MMQRRTLVLSAAGALAIAGLMWWLFVWLMSLPDAERTNAIAVITALGTVAAALAAIGSLFAATASKDSARESAETARQARRAMVLHNRPTGYLRSWCKFDAPPAATEGPGGILRLDEPAGTIWGEAPNHWPEDVVKAQIHVDGPSGVTEVRFSYRTPAGQQAPLRVMDKELLPLPGVVPTVKEHTQWLTPVSVSDWKIICRDRDTRSLWRVSGTTAIEDGRLIMDELEFVLME